MRSPSPGSGRVLGGSRADRGRASAAAGGRRGVGADAGSVAAEFAALVPAVLLVLAFCLGAVQVVGQQLRLTDAAADAARSLARGDGQAQAAARVRQSVGAAARMSTHTQGDFVCVRLASEAAFAPASAMGMTVAAQGCALGGGSGDAAGGGEGGGGP